MRERRCIAMRHGCKTADAIPAAEPRVVFLGCQRHRTRSLADRQNQDAPTVGRRRQMWGQTDGRMRLRHGRIVKVHQQRAHRPDHVPARSVPDRRTPRCENSLPAPAPL